MREYVRRLLGSQYDIEAVADGEAALAVLRRSRRPDLLLSDVMMPRLDGLGLLRAVRADPALADLPVILLSARAGEEASIAGLEAGADDYLVKPFSARELLARVAANIKLSQLRREFERRTAFDLQAMSRLHKLSNLCAEREIDFNECFNEILDAAIALTGADKGNIQLFDPKSESLTIAAQRGFEKPFLDFFAEIRNGEAVACGAAMAAASRILVEDVSDSAIFAGQPSLDVLLQAGVRALQSAPLMSSNGSVIGMISTHFSLPHRPSEQELRFMDLLARQAADYLERKRADAALRELNDTLERKIEERTRALESEMAERQRIEAALQQTQRLEVIGQVTGGVAHDFNNLLMIVGGNLELLKGGRGDAQQVIAGIEQAVARGENLVRQLLSFSRRQSLHPEVLDLSSWTPKLIELLRPSLRGDIDLAAEVTDNIWPVEADPGELELALLNIAVNARDAMPRGGRITVSVRNIQMEGQSTDGLSGDFVRIAVSDTGIGIPAHLLPKVFDPFFTTKEVGKGTGLGLSQVHGFAKQAGGTALIDSRVGEGTTVALFLPRARTSLLPSELETAVQLAD
ncbi:MAG: response regulator [Alphaproteobacteria bacterium]|nr:response regulator [Alphaproteobacteria bacterium]